LIATSHRDPGDWDWPGLPESLKNLAKALSTDTKVATYDLSQRLGREPSRIISDHKSGRWAEWIEQFIGRERGFWWLNINPINNN